MLLDICSRPKRQTAFSVGSSLIRVHGFCFPGKIVSEINLDLCSRLKKQTTFSGQENNGGLRAKSIHLGDNCIQNFNLGRYIVGYTFANL